MLCTCFCGQGGKQAKVMDIEKLWHSDIDGGAAVVHFRWLQLLITSMEQLTLRATGQGGCATDAGVAGVRAATIRCCCQTAIQYPTSNIERRTEHGARRVCN